MLKTYRGGCHCGAVTFEAGLDLTQPSFRCNCSICRRTRFWPAVTGPEGFRLLPAESALRQYLFNTKKNEHYFRKRCGVRCFGIGNETPIGKMFGVNLGCLTDVTEEELARVPITYVDGLHNQWQNRPAFYRHLSSSKISKQGGSIMPGNTVRLHRVFRTTPERLYRAFLDADAMVKWLPPNGFTARVHQMDTKIGGSYKMSFTNFTTGRNHSFGGTYVELVPNERVRYTDQFDDPNLPGEMQTTVSLRKVSCGTELNVVQEGIPEAIPAEACYLGWQESLVPLGKLVEAEVPD